MVKFLESIQMVVCVEDHLPSKVNEAVQQLHGMMERNDQSDAGLAATFCGIAQGKTFLKSANSKATSAQKENQHLQELTSCLSEIDGFTQNMPESSSPNFDWANAVKHGLDTFKSLSEALSKSVSNSAQSSKNLLSTSKKSLSEFVSTISKAFIMSPCQKWFKVAASKFTESKTLHPIPEIKLSEWKGIANSKVITSNSSSFCKFAIETDALIKNIADGLKAYVENGKDLSGSAQLFVQLVDSMDAFVKSTGMQTMQGAGIVGEEWEKDFKDMNDLVVHMCHTQVELTLNKTIQTLGNLMAKVPYQGILRKNIFSAH